MHYFTLITVFVNAPKYPNPKLVREAAQTQAQAKQQGKHVNACPSTLLGGGYATGTAVDRFTQVKEPLAGPIAAAGGDAHGWGSHSGAIVHTGGCIVVLQLEQWQAQVHMNELTLSGAVRCSGRAHAWGGTQPVLGGHAFPWSQ